MQCFHQFIHLHIFQDIRDCACFQGGKDVYIFMVRSQYYDLCARTDLSDSAGSLDAVHARHNQIKQDDIRDQLRNKRKCLLPGSRLSDHMKIWDRFQIGSNTVTDHFVVINDENTGAMYHNMFLLCHTATSFIFSWSRYCSLMGTWTITRVPCPGALC